MARRSNLQEQAEQPAQNLALGEFADANAHLVSLLLKNLPLITYVCKASEDFGALHCGGSAQEITGFTPDEFISKSDLWVERLHPDDKCRILEDLQSLFVRGFHVQEYRWRKKDGTYIWFMDLLRLIREADGTPKHIVGAWFDITEKKRSEDELAKYRGHLEELVGERTKELALTNARLEVEINERIRAERQTAAEKERLRVTLESIADGVIATDISGKIVFMNRVAEAISGWSLDVASGLDLEDVFNTTPRTTSELLLAEVRIGAPLDLRQDRKGDIVLIDREGCGKTIARRAAAIRDERGNLLGMVIAFRDTTSERRIEAELLRAQKLESLGILAGGIAHDFNNILTGILGNISVARASLDPSGKAAGKLSIAEKACSRAKDLTEQLLTFSKGGLPIKRTMFINELLRDTAQMILGGTDCEGSFAIDSDLWPADVDEGQLSQVFANLLLNAQQSMPGGGTVFVEASNIKVRGEEGLNLIPGDYLCVSVRDSGSGIKDEDQERIFDPYFTTKPTGTGLGLTTAYSIVKHHCGQIALHSKVGEGTTFSVYLPAADGGVNYTVSEENQEDAEASHGRILLADDEELVRDTATSILSHLGYTVQCANDGAEAFEIYRQHKEAGNPFDAVILDLTAPGGVGGKEAIEMILDYDPAAKVLVSSGYSNDPIMANFRDYGFREVVAKPYNIDTLAQVLAQVLHSV